MTDPARLLLAAVRLDRQAPAAALRGALEALEAGVGGFLVFGGSCDAVRALAARLRSEAEGPLWLAADLERGAGQQFRGASSLPPPGALARHPRPEEAVRAAARLTAVEARELGLNWALAPVLDLDVEPRNPIVGTRSFGADPAVAGRLGRAWIEACQAEGVAACAKHFPGHGRTTADSHMDLPVVEAGRRELEEDLEPFRAVADVAAGVMAAHVAYPALGCRGPASRSPEVLGDLLRGELGFEGLVVTDALVMAGFGGGDGTGAATEGWRAVRALRAGCDLLLYPGDVALVARTIRQAAAADPGLAGLVDAAAERSARTLRRFDGAGGGPGGGAGSGGGHGPGGPAPGLPPFRPEAPELTQLAAACVRPAGGEGEAAASRRVDAWLEAAAGRTRIAVVSDEARTPGGGIAADAEVPEADAAGAGVPGTALARELERRGWVVEGPSAPGTAADADRGASGAPAALLVLLRATPRAWKGRAGLSEDARARLRALAAEGRPVLPVACGHPRLLEAEGLSGLAAWAAEPVMERGAAAWLAERASRPPAG